MSEIAPHLVSESAQDPPKTTQEQESSMVFHPANH